MIKKAVLILVVLVVAAAAVVYFLFPGVILQWGIDRERGAAGLTEKKVRVDDHEIAYLEGGRGETIVMVHGFAANKDNWTRFAKYITPRYHVVAPDLPGFGDTTYLESASYSYAKQAERLDRFVAALGLGKFHIVGNSMGGHISGWYAVSFPDKVLTLGLFDAAGVNSPQPSELAVLLSKGEPNPLTVQTPEDFDRLMTFVFVKPPEIPGFVKKLLIEEGNRHFAGNQRIFKEISETRISLEADLGRISARTLVLWGDRDRVLDASGADVFAAGIPNAVKVLMKDCGHVPMIERPEEAARHYLEFLEKK